MPVPTSTLRFKLITVNSAFSHLEELLAAIRLVGSYSDLVTNIKVSCTPAMASTDTKQEEATIGKDEERLAAT